MITAAALWPPPSIAQSGDAPNIQAGTNRSVLVENGVSRAPIIVAEGTSPETMRAAEELAGYIEKTANARPDIIAGNPNPAPAQAIWVGFQPNRNGLFPGVRFTFEKPEEILIVGSENHLAIVGRDRMVGGVQTEYGTANPRTTPSIKRLAEEN
ncbi:MAG: hypothetical protein ACUVQK_16000 [Thermogutta sp.]